MCRMPPMRTVETHASDWKASHGKGREDDRVKLREDPMSAYATAGHIVISLICFANLVAGIDADCE